MTYRERITPWIVVRRPLRQLRSRSSLLQNEIIQRFHTRSNAQEYANLLTQQLPNYEFEVMFDAPLISPHASP